MSFHRQRMDILAHPIPQGLVDQLVTLDAVPARFRDYDVGDTVPLQMHSMGFGGLETNVRIWGRTYAPNLNLCGLVVREEA